MEIYDQVCESLQQTPKSLFINVVAGFIVSNLLEYLLRLNQKVVCLDNFAAGYDKNLEEVRKLQVRMHGISLLFLMIIIAWRLFFFW